MGWEGDVAVFMQSIEKVMVASTKPEMPNMSNMLRSCTYSPQGDAAEGGGRQGASEGWVEEWTEDGREERGRKRGRQRE